MPYIPPPTPPIRRLVIAAFMRNGHPVTLRINFPTTAARPTPHLHVRRSAHLSPKRSGVGAQVQVSQSTSPAMATPSP